MSGQQQKGESSESSSKGAQEGWEDEKDPEVRRRLQNRDAQRRYSMSIDFTTLHSNCYKADPQSQEKRTKLRKKPKLECKKIHLLLVPHMLPLEPEIFNLERPKVPLGVATTWEEVPDPDEGQR